MLEKRRDAEVGKKKTIHGQCALCRQNKELQLSHIVPHFVGRRMIKTAPGDIRVTNEPNIVAQDIEKHYMLCHDCEELFSAKERWFASNIFNPWQDHKQREFSYDENLTYFIVSLSWRSLYLDLEEYSCDSTFDKEILLTMLRAESIMRDYLLGKRQDVSDIQNHIFFFDRIESASNYDFEKNPSVAMHRSITSYSAYNGDTSFTISNLLGIMIVTFYSMTEQEEWTNTHILNGSGTIAAKKQGIKSVVGQEIQHWMNEAENAKNNLSEKQKNKIIEKMKNLGDGIKDYAIFQDFFDDENLRRNNGKNRE